MIFNLVRPLDEEWSETKKGSDILRQDAKKESLPG